jgi:hypothetical protein
MAGVLGAKAFAEGDALITVRSELASWRGTAAEISARRNVVTVIESDWEREIPSDFLLQPARE